MTEPDQFSARFCRLVSERNQLTADVAHWNHTHPKAERLEGTADEIDESLDVLAEQIPGAEVQS